MTDRTFRKRAWIGLVLLSFITSAAHPVGADPAAGEALFREGRRLFEQGNIAEACAKFAASQALDPSSGTLLNLADCHQEQGKTATAWAEFLAAAQLAQMQRKPQHESEAARRADALEAELSFLSIEVVEPRPGLEVRKDGELIPAGVLGTRIPVDPGERILEVAAPGYEKVRLAIVVGPARDQKRVTVPPLKPSPTTAEARRPPAPESETGARGTQARAALDAGPSRPSPSVLPWVLGGAGIAAIGVGSVFGVMALSSDDEAEDACKARVECSDEAVAAADRRDRQAWVANIGIGAGVVAVGVATVWLLTRDDDAAVPTASKRARVGGGYSAEGALVPGGFVVHVERAF